ncbi:uncharacterized protein LOC114525656 [Dendronephthya gigantea]|uniref:uncharacterized protein LOC114525656 n=1 Tax=Dendronephthya gigantea TaxID=151771 RepID=UPI00106CBC02|nr:uncharacterized protein LOC114525656 [Dendronephthya gigantea]
MAEEINVSVIVDQLRAAGTDSLKQLPALLKLGEFYLKKAKASANGADFTKANALFNAALVRSDCVDHTTDEDEVLRRIVETFRAFLLTLTNDKEMSSSEIRNEIHAHKEFLARERRILQESIEEIDSSFNTKEQTEDQYKIHAEKMHDVFRDIQDMYVRLVSMLVKECESRLGQKPCDYAIIALGSVARMEATPFSDLEFAILYSDQTIGDKVNYFRVLSHFLHMKVINLGETILPTLAIEELNDFQSSDPNSNWFYDSQTCRGISFDGAMPWASKTALGRMATQDKPALELIKTPEQMAELQDEKIAVKEGYHLADIMSRATLLYGERPLFDEYNERVAEKLNAVTKFTPATVGFVRGIQQMMLDIASYHPYYSYLGSHCTIGAFFDAKKQFYRLISLLLSDLGLVFDVRCASPWQVISALQARGIIDDTEGTSIRVCLSIANEIRLKTYLANGGQKELISPIPKLAGVSAKSTEPPIFRHFNEDYLVRLLSTSKVVNERCHVFCMKYLQDHEIDVSIFKNLSVSVSSPDLLGTLYFRLQNFPKALQLLQFESQDSPNYSLCLNSQGIIYNEYGEYAKGLECFQRALEVHYQNVGNSKLSVLHCLENLALSYLYIGLYEKARDHLEKAIAKHHEMYGKDTETIVLNRLMQNIGMTHYKLGDVRLAIKIFLEVKRLQEKLFDVPDIDIIHLNLNIALSLSELDDQTQSLEYVKEALHLSKRLFGEADQSVELAKIYVNAATVYERCNLNDQALFWYERSLELLKLIFGDISHPGKISCLNNLGNFFSRRYQTTKAIESLENALKQARDMYCEKPHITVALTLNNLGVALKRAEKSEESFPYFQEAKEVMDQILGPNHVHPTTSDILNNMGTIYQDLGLLDETLKCYKDVHQMNCAIYGENGVSDAMATVCSNIACVSEELGDYTQAKEYYSKAVELDRKISSAKNTSPGLVSSLYGLSSICEVLDESDEALKHLEEAREVAKNAGSKNVMVATVLVELGMKYNKLGCIDKRKMCLNEAKEIAESLAQDDSLSPSVMELVEILKGGVRIK